MNIKEAKEIFFTRNDEFLFYPAVDVLHPSFVRFREDHPTLSKDQLNAIRQLLSGTVDEQYFVFYIISVIDTLPDDILELIVSKSNGLSGIFLEFIYSNLRRMFGWPLVEKLLHRLLQNGSTYANKFWLMLHIKANIIEDYFEIKDGNFKVVTKQNYEWNGQKYVSQPTNNLEVLNPYRELIQPIYLNRLKLLLKIYLNDKTPVELLRLMKIVMPNKCSSYPESLQAEILAAIAKSRTIVGSEF